LQSGKSSQYMYCFAWAYCIYF